MRLRGRNIPDLFDVVYCTYGRDGCSVQDGHCGLLSIRCTDAFVSSRVTTFVEKGFFRERFGICTVNVMQWILESLCVEGLEEREGLWRY